MSPAHRLLPLLLLCASCKLLAKDAPPENKAAQESEKADDDAHEEAAAPEGHGAPAGTGRYGVPFAYERSPEEPLAKARQFMAEVLKDNVAFSRGRPNGAQSDAENPRATVLTCSDSRVQTSAWDATPDNDSYTVRNLGNQLGTSLGSIEYGVDTLHTPVLLIIGHTGCDAVASALAGGPKEKGPVADEITRITKPRPKTKGRGKEKARDLTDAVIDNVNAQVTTAVGQFASRVQSGDLTVVGAVYDPKDELGNGAGRLQLVNVNGNTDPERVKAFEEAINEQNRKAAPTAARRSSPDDKARAFLDGSMRMPPGTRATVNAVSIVGSGGFDALSEGAMRNDTLRGASPDLRPARGYRPAPSSGSEHDEAGSSPEQAAHGAPAGARDARNADDSHATSPRSGKAPALENEKAAKAPEKHAKGAAEAPEKDEHAEAAGKMAWQGPAKAAEKDAPKGEAKAAEKEAPKGEGKRSDETTAPAEKGAGKAAGKSSRQDAKGEAHPREATTGEAKAEPKAEGPGKMSWQGPAKSEAKPAPEPGGDHAANEGKSKEPAKSDHAPASKEASKAKDAPTKEAPKGEAKADGKDAKPEAKADGKDAKPEAKADGKGTSKAGDKAEPKGDAKGEGKAHAPSKPEPKHGAGEH